MPGSRAESASLHPSLDSRLTLEVTDQTVPGVAIIERKGRGHPDTLTDNLAEALSRVYAAWCLEHVGAVLHHNFDKVTTHGGAVRVVYGGGEVLAPIRVMVNGRVTRRCGQVVVPSEDLVTTTVRAFFTERLPAFADHLDIQLNLTSNSSPGSVPSDGHDQTDRSIWFDIEHIDQLRERQVLLANDTSMGTGFYPLSPLEMLAAELVDELSGDDGFRRGHPWCGTDVKLMLVGEESSFDVVVAVPQVSTYVRGREEYARNKATVLEHCQQMVEKRLGEGASDRCTFRVNARDIEARDELYLTLSGSSLESGDEGVVGRGNRANGLITPLRPMNIEGVNGKNPVYHVGKLYNVAAVCIAQLLHERFSGHHQVVMVSATGQELAYPWRIHIRSSVPIAIGDAADAVLSVTEQSARLTAEILAGQHALA